MSVDKRLHYLDWLRLLAVFLGLVFHAGRPFDGWPWIIKGPEIGWLTYFNEALTTVRLPLLFFVSGAATVFALRKASAITYATDRFKRLIIPLVVGVLLIVPPQQYIRQLSLDARNPQHFEGSYGQFLTGPWWGDGTFLFAHLRTEHLWFLLYLFYFSLLALPVFLYLRSPLGLGFLARLEIWLQAAPWRIWLLVITPAALGALLPLGLGSHPGLAEDLANLGFYFELFVLGFALYLRPGLLQVVFGQSRQFLLAGLGLILLKAYFYSSVLHRNLFVSSELLTYHELYWLLRDLAALSLIFAILTYARRFLDKPSGFLDRARHWVYPFYIWHQTVIVVMGYFVLKLSLPVSWLYVLLLMGSLVVTVLLSELVQHSTISRFLFGVHRKAQAETQPATTRTSRTSEPN
ncbi:acyltransferase family protein [Meiothermus taiwanensis]|jgi:glucan biosynthesis protein C|uniref:Acyltransferase family protein n=1 Tax=Meiothermus taiwanensis WR-220 TaxID=1339250 RepID=A0ABM6WKZ7_9DEIN|nr:acyltransferase family protein [Meiothermus taiwanensis]AWR87736.1 acyltransferase family protein [Meiothermus taiwanensis WR-220]KIQ54592.1 acyltransferase [Meiothermus taiwanensis]KZK15214.1 acyltransferase [Meiothermus taiwanensis]